MNTTVACPGCAMPSMLPADPRQRAVFICGNCEEELFPPSRLTDALVEAARFLKNAFLILSLPVLFAACFLHLREFHFTFGLMFVLSLTLASVVFHEFFHALAAFALGDRSVYHRGYLSLNPLKYLLGFHSLFFPAMVFLFSGIFLPGAGVHVRFDRIPNPLSRSVVFLAGVLANVIFLAAIIAVLKSGAAARESDFNALLQFAAFCQVCIIFFNLLPIPGLDGWGVIAPIFAEGVQKLMNALSPVIVIVFAVLLIGSESVNSRYASSIADIVSRLELQSDAIHAGRSYAVILGPDGCLMCREMTKLNLASIR